MGNIAGNNLTVETGGSKPEHVSDTIKVKQEVWGKHTHKRRLMKPRKQREERARDKRQSERNRHTDMTGETGN